GPCSQYLHDPLVKQPCVAKSLLSTGRYLASKQAASLQGERPKPDFQKPALSLWEIAQPFRVVLSRREQLSLV
ncbi:hypothetical protein ACGLHT_26380, partial [Pseudomonas sp. PsB]|uniref:hypothetical protein n=1 Tax=Pseudomonas sp. PsB TaxID=89774 RepID=UPI003748FC7C